jgi:hypothetical protein
MVYKNLFDYYVPDFKIVKEKEKVTLSGAGSQLESTL